MSESMPAEGRLDVSVIIATRDRAESLDRTLETLAAQQLDDVTWEIIVVDNASTDGTPDVLTRAGGALPLVALHEPRPGKSHALNRALAAAKGDLLVFTDDDVLAEEDWVASLVAAARRWPEDDIFGGAITASFPPGSPSWMQDSSFPYSRWAFGGYHPREDEGFTSETPIGGNMAVRARALNELPFDPSLGPGEATFIMGEEVDLMLRMFRRGHQFVFVPSARVTHVLSPQHVTKTNLDARAYRCGRANARLFPTVSRVPVFGIPLYHVGRAVSTALGLVSTSAGPESARWLASMEWNLIRGHIAERLAMRRQTAKDELHGFAHQPLFPSWATISSVMRRDGLAGLVLRPLRAVCRPVFWIDQVHVFECPTSSAVPEGRSDDLDVTVYSGTESSREVCVWLCRLETLAPEVIERRLAQGDSVAVAFDEGRPVGYAWCAFRSMPVFEVGVTLLNGPESAIGYDGFVIPTHRGARIIKSLDTAQMVFARGRGVDTHQVFASAANRASVRSLQAMGKRRLFTVRRARAPLLGWQRVRAREAGFGDRFVEGADGAVT